MRKKITGGKGTLIRVGTNEVIGTFTSYEFGVEYPEPKPPKWFKSLTFSADVPKQEQ